MVRIFNHTEGRSREVGLILPIHADPHATVVLLPRPPTGVPHPPDGSNMVRPKFVGGLATFG